MSLPTHTILIGNLYDKNGFLSKRSVEVEIDSFTVRVGGTLHNVEAFEFDGDTLTSPSGWYVVCKTNCFSVAWSQGENGDTVASNMTRDEAIEWANTAYADWGNAGHPDYKGVSWVVSDDSEVIYSTPACK